MEFCPITVSMSPAPLMPKATAAWLIEHTSMTFTQIATFCQLHPLEVQNIADEENGYVVRGIDPIQEKQLTRDEINRAEADPNYEMRLTQSSIQSSAQVRKGPRYTPVSRRQDRPNAILWLLRNHPELSDRAISRLVGTTKTTIDSIRTRSHWNYSNLAPSDPVTLGLCLQSDLDKALLHARPASERTETTETPVPADTFIPGGAKAQGTDAVQSAFVKAGLAETKNQTEPVLPSTDEAATSSRNTSQSDKTHDDPDVDSVFAKLKALRKS